MPTQPRDRSDYFKKYRANNKERLTGYDQQYYVKNRLRVLERKRNLYAKRKEIAST